MTQPTLISNANREIPQRRHYDPPALWVATILGSAVIHLCAFGLLRLLLLGGLPNLQSSRNLIAVDVIGIPAEAKTRTQAIQNPVSSATRQPRSINSPVKRTSNRTVNPQTPAKSTGSASHSGSQQPGRQSPATPSSGKQPSERSPKPTSSKPSPSQPTGKSPDKISPHPSPSKPSDQSPQPPAPGSQPDVQPGGGFSASLGGLGLTDNRRDIPTQFAKLKSDSTTEFPIDYLTPLGIKLNGAIVLKVKVLIDETGQGRVLPDSTQVVSGDISATQAEQLAQQIIESWSFEPTYMGNGPVAQAYNLELRISPPIGRDEG
ncbi:MAG TPA: hypothetical protein DC064_20670 [Cyanobacteria bacterium UBA9273]|nr:hypothetical protein [Cyanobacteria bacterium UBA9273]